MTKGKDIFKAVDAFAPFKTAQSWDNSGFLCGNSEKEVKSILVTLDITQEVVKEAVEKKVDLILAHHPLIFTPLKSITDQTAEGRMLFSLIQNDIAAICAHTNLDVAKEGVNFALARKLGLCDIVPVTKEYETVYKKIAVYVPVEFTTRVRDAMFEAGGGQLGNYSHCSFSSSGKGTFMPGEGAKPFIGEKDTLEQLNEVKIEMIVPEEKCDEVISFMLAAHPYETPAYDVFYTEAPKEYLGFCAVGDLAEGLSDMEFLNLVKTNLNCEGLRYCGEKGMVRRVGVGGGSCVSFADQIFDMGADVFVTGDIKYHEFLDGAQKGQFLVDAGHFPTENIICEPLAAMISSNFPDIEVSISETHADVIRFL